MPSAFPFFLFFSLMIILGFGGAPVFHDPDTAWHLATGDLIRSLGVIPKRDEWSFTATHEVWYNLSWAFDWFISWLFSLGGFSGIYLFTVLIFNLSIILVMNNALKRGASHLSLIALSIPVVMIMYGCTLARPNMLSVLFTVFFYLVLTRFRENRQACYLIILPALMALWVNIHGGFLLAYPLIGFFLLESFVPLFPCFCQKSIYVWKKINSREPQDKANLNCFANRVSHKHFISLLLVMLSCLLASLINPYGIAIYYGAYKSIAADFSQNLVEWKAVEIGKDSPVTILLLLLLCFSNFFDRRIAVADRLIGVFITLLALSSLRHTGVAAILLIPYLALRITYILQSCRFAVKAAEIETMILGDMQKKDVRILAGIMAVAVCILLYLPAIRDGIIKDPIEPMGFQVKKFPVKEAQFIEQHYPGKRFFNHYNIGGYLAYLWRGRVKLFVDGRANSLYSDDFLDDYLEFNNNHGFGTISGMIAAQYQLDGLILPNDDKDFWAWNSNPAWKAVYRGEVATVYVRK